MKAFITKFADRKVIDKSMLYKNNNNYFLITPKLKPFTKLKPEAIGLYLGKDVKEQFIPSPNLLNILKDHTKEKIILDEKTAWLFICGRIIFEESVLKTTGMNKRKLVLNQEGEVLGVAKQIKDFYKNVFDLGDFLRRERS